MKTGLYSNIAAKRKRIAAGSGEKMRKVGSKGAPTEMAFKQAAKMELGREVIANSHINNQDITLINGAAIYVRGADRTDTLRGVSLTYAVLDEVADIKPETWEQVIRASLSAKKVKK